MKTAYEIIQERLKDVPLPETPLPQEVVRAAMTPSDKAESIITDYPLLEKWLDTVAIEGLVQDIRSCIEAGLEGQIQFILSKCFEAMDSEMEYRSY